MCIKNSASHYHAYSFYKTSLYEAGSYLSLFSWALSSYTPEIFFYCCWSFFYIISSLLFFKCVTGAMVCWAWALLSILGELLFWLVFCETLAWLTTSSCYFFYASKLTPPIWRRACNYFNYPWRLLSASTSFSSRSSTFSIIFTWGDIRELLSASPP